MKHGKWHTCVQYARIGVVVIPLDMYKEVMDDILQGFTFNEKMDTI